MFTNSTPVYAVANAKETVWFALHWAVDSVGCVDEPWLVYLYKVQAFLTVKLTLAELLVTVT